MEPKTALDEDTPINAAPRELQEKYELAQVSGDKERIEEVLTILRVAKNGSDR